MSKVIKNAIVLGAGVSATVVNANAQTINIQRDGVSQPGLTVERTRQVDTKTVHEVNNLIDVITKQSTALTLKDVRGRLTNEDATDIKSNGSRVIQALREYERLQQNLQTQKTSHLMLTGQMTSSTNRDISYASYEDLANQLEAFNTRLQDMVRRNQETLRSEATVSDEALAKAVKDANTVITNVSSTATGAESGIRGNYSRLNVAATDSKNAGGVVVDTTKTQNLNAITTNMTFKPEVEVHTIDQVNRERDRIVAAIQAQKTTVDGQIQDANRYSNQGKENITDINQWLDTEKARAARVGEVIEQNSTAHKTMKTYRDEYLEKLRTARAKIADPSFKVTDRQRQEMLKNVDEAIANLTKSAVDMRVTREIKSAENVNFGNIGRPNGEVKQIQRDASAQIDAIIDDAIRDLTTQNAVVENRMRDIITTNKQSVEQFLKDIENGGGGTQIDENWLNNLSIYRDSPQYREYIKKALQATGNIDTRPFPTSDINNNESLKVADGTSVAEVASFLQKMRSEELGGSVSFGSVILPSANVNDFARVGGEVYADSQSYPGGLISMVNDFDYVLRSAAEDGFHKTGPGIDLDGEFNAFNVTGSSNGSRYSRSSDTDKVHMIISKGPKISYILNNAFAFEDVKTGEIKLSDTVLDIEMTDVNGNAFPRSGVANGEEWKYDVFYVFYIKVNKDNGTLAVAGGYVPYLASKATEHGGTGGGGTGDNSGRNMLLGNLKSNDTGENIMHELTDFTGSTIVIGGVAHQYDYHSGTFVPMYVEESPYEWIDRVEYDTNATSTVGNASSGNTNAGNINWKQYYGGFTASKVAGTLSRNDHVNGWAGSSGIARGVRLNIGVRVNSNAQTSATMSPLYVSDIDTNQTVYVNSGFGTTAGYSDYSSYIVSSRFGGSNFKAASSSSNGTTKEAILDDYSIVILDKDRGLNDTKIGISSITPGAKSEAITINLFSPFGMRGTAFVNVKQINETIDTFTLGNPSAVAHTDHNSNLTRAVEYLRAGDTPPPTSRVSAETLSVLLEKFQLEAETERLASSNNSFIVRQFRNKRVASQNSMVVRTLAPKRVSSQNSFVVRTLAPKRVSSQNSFIIRTLSGSNMVLSQPTITKVPLKVYVEESIQSDVNQALNDWKLKLSNHVDLQLETVMSMKDADLTFLDVDNDTTKLDYGRQTLNVTDDAAFEFGGIGGRAVYKIEDVTLTDDEFSISGLKSSRDLAGKQAIQLNTEALTNRDLRIKILRHEIGHMFGLEHDENDTLMTSTLTNPNFTGEISERNVKQASENLKQRV